MPKNILLSQAGKPYISEKVVINTMRLRKIKGAVPVKVEGGWGIKTGLSPEDIQKLNEPVEASVGSEEAIIIEEPVISDTIPEEDDEETRILLNGSWQQAKNAFDIIEPYKDKRFKYRWANPKNKQETRIEELGAQGWQIDPVMKGKINHLSAYKDQSNKIGTATIIRGKMLMRIPRHMAEQRNKHYSDMANNGLKQQQQEFKEATGDKSYGGIHIS